MRPARGALDAGDGADQARLAGAVGAHDGDELALAGPQSRCRRAPVRRRRTDRVLSTSSDQSRTRLLARGSIRARRGSRRHLAPARPQAITSPWCRTITCADSAITARMTCSMSRMVRPSLALSSRRTRDHVVDLGRAQAGHHLVEQQQRGPVASARATSSRLRSGSVRERGHLVALGASPSCSITSRALLPWPRARRGWR